MTRDEREGAVSAARALERWGADRDWAGSDPYDGLNANRFVGPLRGSALGRRILTQAVKRSPLNLRPLLGIEPVRDAATLAHLISAYARNGFLAADETARKLNEAVSALGAQRAVGFENPCWGYSFDVTTRVFSYPRGTPNTIATAFAGLALLDADAAGQPGALELATGAAEFFLAEVPQTEAGDGAFFGYLPGDRTPIHNASMLVAALLARLSARSGRADLGAAAEAAVRFTVERQRPDGSWPYAEAPGLEWVDGFHTGYVLDCLLACDEAGVGAGAAGAAWERGIAFYARELIGEDGTPRYTPGSAHPIDGQCAAQAIQTLALGGARDRRLGERAWDVFAYTRRRLARADGAFAFQRRRLWVNRTPHPRWVQAPMLAALACLIGEDPA